MCYVKSHLGVISLLRQAAAPVSSSTSDDSDNIARNDSCVTNHDDNKLTSGGDRIGRSNDETIPESGYDDIVRTANVFHTGLRHHQHGVKELKW